MGSDEQVLGGSIGDRAGWAARFPQLRSSSRTAIVDRLQAFIANAGAEQVRAWKESIPLLQSVAGRVLDGSPEGATYSSILEYLLFMDDRRADALFLVAGPVLVLELKGASYATQAALDQVAAYARDIAAYHRDCSNRPVRAILVPTGMKGSVHESAEGVWVSGPDRLGELVQKLAGGADSSVPSLERFLDDDAYRPLPTLVEAARSLFDRREVRRVWKADARTSPAVEYVVRVARDAASQRSRHLVLVTGVPGSGKTLVGLRLAHSRVLDQLAVARNGVVPTAPGLFLSGNGPLVQVLQYAFKDAGAGGQTFVRHIKSYLDSHVPRPNRLPSEHVLVFDEAQRAFSSDMVKEKHPKWSGDLVASEPELFVRVCDRIPEWSVLVGLVGTGQEIHLGEEAGVLQWRDAVERSGQASRWTVHAPPRLAEKFEGFGFKVRSELALNLDFALRFHSAELLHTKIARILERDTVAAVPATSVAAEVEGDPVPSSTAGLRLWITRDLQAAKSYLLERYVGQPDARFGLIASSRDRRLIDFGVDNSWNATKIAKLGPWFMDPATSPLSCCQLNQCITEFQIQGLELDMALLAWGTDFRRVGGGWSNADARRYKAGAVKLIDPMALRINAYRVLLTRGRDGTIVFVPPIKEMNETYEFLRSSGFKPLPTGPVFQGDQV